SELTSQRLRYRTPQLPKQRTACSSACAIASPNSPNSDRTPPTSQTAIAPPQLQTAIAPLQLPKQRLHPLNSPNSDRTPSTLQTAHPSNFPKAITLPHSPNSDRTP
ncbi:hypothetical protein, partial [Aphanizomenon flos-aquae]|uniref:hypothetical protein n=1 Tax=Aphanizomenon flos-aquae TaxID=1176 RepID=UPI001F3596A6